MTPDFDSGEGNLRACSNHAFRAIYALRIAASTTDSDSVGGGPTPSGRAKYAGVG